MGFSSILLAGVLATHFANGWLLSRAVGLRGDDRFWGVILGTFAQWGTLATVLSLAHALTRNGWLAGLAVITIATVTVAAVTSAPRRVEAQRARPRRRSRMVATAGTCVLAVVVLATIVIQWGTPLHKGDDLMYHGSRALYWLEHRSLLPFPTHNDRQNVFPAGGELPFLLGVMFTRSERAARLLHLSAFPLCLWGLHRLQRRLGVRGPGGVVGLVLFATTPIVLSSAEGIGTELWTTLGLLGVAHGLVSVVHARQAGRRAAALFGLGALAALAASFKLTMIAVLAVLPLPLALLGRRRVPPALASRGLLFTAGLTAGAITTGLALTLVANAFTYGHPLGPPAMRAVHASGLEPRSLRVHAARLAFLLVGIPEVWSEKTREFLEAEERHLADTLAATTKLPWERRPGWPGQFDVHVPAIDDRFSLTALLGVAASGWAVGRTLRLHRRGRSVTSWAPAWVLFVCAGSALAVVAVVRWQAAAGIPDRLLVAFLAPFAALSSLATRAIGTSRVRQVLVAVLVSWGAAPGLQTVTVRLAAVLIQPSRPPGRVGIFADAAAALPEGARVLLVSNQNSGDYVLFAPERRYSNEVIPWGQEPFDRARLLERLAHDRPSHVLIENATRVDFHWGGTLSTRDFVAAIADLPGARRIPLPDPDIRLFAL